MHSRVFLLTHNVRCRPSWHIVPSRRSLSRMMTFFRSRNSFEGQKCGEWIEDGEPRGSHEQLECLPSASGVRKP
jgi:hypothetical protein